MLRPILWSCLAASLALAAAGCGGSAAIHAAEAGRFADLARLLQADIRSGSLDDDDARAIALAVASFEIVRARPPSGSARLLELRTCARHVADGLVERSAGTDPIAPTAAMILLEAGLADIEATKQRSARLATAADPVLSVSFRAVHARTLVGPGDGPTRRARMLDGDQDVRVAALRASIVTADPGDRDALLDAARLDPFPMARTLAIRAAATIGGETVVLALRDLWALADQPDREAIADAWASPRAIDTGGRKQLLWAISTQRGAPAIAAARTLANAGAAGAADAIGALIRAIDSGPTKDRVYAIQAAPMTDPRVREAVTKAEHDNDEAVALAALTRQVEAAAGVKPPSARAPAVSRLLRIANGSTTAALTAKGALARAGVREVIPILTRDVRSRDDRVREAAGAALVDLGERVHAAPLLADAVPHVRTSIACAILRGP